MENFKKVFTLLRKMLEGKKTYFLALITAGYVLLQSFGVINTTPDQDVAVYGFLGALFAMSIGAKIDRAVIK